MRRVAIHSVPRSGSTWLGAIFDSHPDVIYKYQPLFSYRFKDRISPKSSAKEIQQFFKELADVNDDFLDQVPAKKEKIVPKFGKDEKPGMIIYKEVRYHHVLENLLEKDPGIKVIGLIRNPLATLYSWLKAPKEFRADKGWKESEEWRFAEKKNLNRPEEFNGYEKWKEVANLFEKLNNRFPDRFYLLKYCELLKQTENTTITLFDFTGLSITDQTVSFIRNSRKKEVNNAYGVYRKKRRDDQWRGNLSFEIVQYIIDDLHGSSLAKYLPEFI